MRQPYLAGLLVSVSLFGCSSAEQTKSRVILSDGTAGTANGGSSGGASSASAGSGSSGGSMNVDDLDAGLTLPLGDPCNGSADYCSKRYDELAYVATRESAATAEAGFQYPTQSVGIRQQLQRGIRALMLSVQEEAGVRRICVGNCALGSSLLTAELGVIKTFLVENPREVVTLLFEADTVSATALAADLEAKLLDSDIFVPEAGVPWPTLAEIISGGRRLVVLGNVSDPEPTWLLPKGLTLWETEPNWSALSAMNCNATVGEPTLPLSLVHHYLSTFDATANVAVGSASSAAEANAIGTVVRRLADCQEHHGRVPNFVAVDFYDTGDVVGATQVLNGVRTL